MRAAGGATRLGLGMPELPMTLGRRLSWIAISALIAILLGVGITLLLWVPSVRAEQHDYAAATPYRCGHGRPPPTGVSCWQGIDGRLLGVAETHTWTGARHTVLTVATGGTQQRIDVDRVPAVACASGAEAVVIRMQGASVASVYTPHGVLPTASDPLVDSGLVLNAGLTLLAAAAMIPTGLYLAVLRRRRLGTNPGVEVLWASPGISLAMAVFLLGQAADVITSAVGEARGLNEGNPLVDAFIRVTGPVGFLLFRLPAVILVLLALSQVPRRVALVTLLGVGLLFLGVGFNNAVLAVGAGGPVTCGAGVALP